MTGTGPGERPARPDGMSRGGGNGPPVAGDPRDEVPAGSSLPRWVVRAPGELPPPLPGTRRDELIVALSFVATFVGGIALLALYAVGGQTQLEGVLLAICLGGVGVGIIVWAQRLLDTPLEEERRESPADTGPVLPEDSSTIRAEAGFTRRVMLQRLMVGAFAGLGAALVIPALSLGPAPGRSLFHTSWRKGLRLVDINNRPVNASQLQVDGVMTVFPEGIPGSPDGQALLIRVPPDLLKLPGSRGQLAPDGYVCYSKVCTHAGCPVGLYRASQHHLICPCHQSTFDVLTGANPTFGPAVRPLPQLPIARQPDGTFVALGDYPDPIGPSFWDIHS